MLLNSKLKLSAKIIHVSIGRNKKVSLVSVLSGHNLRLRV